ncbi:pyridoxal-phosphate dependent enzyme [Roseovarius sp. M141]|uniref:pyridoxal-phosphate dependent enzyme n=1 Tax=Roseovarius sp. M141 TaxID=2583806 RepID=UPI0026E579D7|nr:pyridoxal-phosphate dependent enzyme [Roseovarius sp. M141]
MNNWVTDALGKINADAHRSADTHLFKLPLPRLEGVDIYLKDESTHPTGSLKHRLARSLFLYALCNGRIKQDTTVVEASSGSTAVSEAYFARMIGVPFTAVLPKSTARSKIKLIEFYGGQIHFVDSAPQMHDASVTLAKEIGGYFMDQFTYAERATDWRGNNNIAESLFTQMEHEPHPIPARLVMSAGTGRYVCDAGSLHSI